MRRALALALLAAAPVALAAPGNFVPGNGTLPGPWVTQQPCPFANANACWTSGNANSVRDAVNDLRTNLQSGAYTCVTPTGGSSCTSLPDWAQFVSTTAAGVSQGSIPFAATGAPTQRPPADRAADVVNVKDFLPANQPDGTTDNSAWVQLAANIAIATGARRLYLPSDADPYVITTTLVIENAKGLIIDGDGQRNSILTWKGAASGTAFLYVNSYHTWTRGVRFEALTNQPDILVEVRQDTTRPLFAQSAQSQHNRFDKCTFKGGGVGYAVTLGAGSTDQMNDSHRVNDGLFDAQTLANITLKGNNALGIKFDGCYMTGAPYGVQVQSVPASFEWHGGYVNSSTSNFDFLGYSTDGYKIIGVRSEHSPRFLSGVGSNVGSPFYIAGVYYSSAFVNADGHAISTGAGPMTIVSSTFGDGVSRPPDLNFSFSNPTSVVLQGVSFDAAGADTTTPVVAAANTITTEIGTRVKNNAGVRSVRPNTAPAPAMVTLTQSTSMAIDASVAQEPLFKVVADGTVTISFSTPTNARMGQAILIHIKATGSLNTSSPFQNVNGWRTQWSASWTPPTSGNGYVLRFVYDGVYWYQVGAAQSVVN